MPTASPDPLLTPEQRAAWQRDGYFVLRGFVPPELGLAMQAEAVAAIRADPPAAHPDEALYFTPEGQMIQPQKHTDPRWTEPEQGIAKLMNAHLAGTAQRFALSERAGRIVSEVLDSPDVDVFQSQFIFKHPGALGQPWHQDSHYFPFDQQPQVGLWLAITEATLENGCLSVLPGSHQGSRLRPHGPDLRPGANEDYLEVTDLGPGTETPMLMQPGDLLVFHSYLLHRSSDNIATTHRAAMVYHYGRAGTQPVQALHPTHARLINWRPALRGGRAVDVDPLSI